MASSSPPSLASTWALETRLLVLRVVQLGEAVGQFLAADEQLEAVGDAGLAVASRASG
jgi:hypothetical protein